MNLSALSWPFFALGLAGLAAALFVLQRLRVRHEQHKVVTTLFWREALEESVARVRTDRFRHPLAYLLALLIAGLLWFGFAGPERGAGDGARYTILVDGTQAQLELFAASLQSAQEWAARLPRQRTDVLWCGSGVTSLLQAGEQRALLAQRLRKRSPDSAPPTIERALARVRARGTEFERVVIVCGAAQIASTLDTESEGVQVYRADLGLDVELPLRVTRLGQARSAGATWDRVDVLVAAEGPGAEDATLEVRTGAAAWRPVPATDRVASTPEAAEWILRGLPCSAATLSVRLAGSSAELHMTLPAGSRLPVLLSADVPTCIREALAADPGVRLIEAGGEPAVYVGGAAGAPPGLPHLLLTSAATSDWAFEVIDDQAGEPEQLLRGALGELALDRIDATALATALGREIAVGASAGPVRELRLWRALVEGDSAPWVESRSLPLLLSRGVRWLARVPEPIGYAMAGRALPSPLAAPPTLATQRSEQIPLEAGLMQLADGGTLQVARLAALPPVATRTLLAPEDLEGRGLSIMAWVLGLALVALVADWILHQTGRMP